MLKTQTDPLTGMLNRITINKYILNLLNETPGENKSNNSPEISPFTIAFMDIDYFKSINDKYTHQFGDHLLTEVAKIINSCIEEGDKVGRYGGDEFLFVFENRGRGDIMKTLEQIRGDVEKTLYEKEIDGEKITAKITCSIGIASYPENAGELMELLREADMALFHAKNRGRNQICKAGR